MVAAMTRTAGADLLVDRAPLELEFGAVLPEIVIEYETWGRLSPARDNAILVCPAFSAHSHASASPRDPRPGWWEGMIGPGRAFDTERFFMICPALLGGSYGTTGPKAIDPASGEAYRGAFPPISVRDVVSVHARLLDHLGIERLHAALAVLRGRGGGLVGAQQALRVLRADVPRQVEPREAHVEVGLAQVELLASPVVALELERELELRGRAPRDLVDEGREAIDQAIEEPWSEPLRKHIL